MAPHDISIPDDSRSDMERRASSRRENNCPEGTFYGKAVAAIIAARNASDFSKKRPRLNPMLYQIRIRIEQFRPQFQHRIALQFQIIFVGQVVVIVHSSRKTSRAGGSCAPPVRCQRSPNVPRNMKASLFAAAGVLAPASSARCAPGDVDLPFDPNVSGVTYIAEYSTSLAPGSWTPVSNSGTATNYAFFAPAVTQRLYLRLRVTVPP